MSDMPVESVGEAEQTRRRGEQWRRAGFIGVSLVSLSFAVAGGGNAVANLDALGAAGYALLAGLVVVGLVSVYAITGGRRLTGNRDVVAGLALDALKDACFVTDAGGGVVMANAAYRQMCGAGEQGRIVPLDRLGANIEQAADHLFRLCQAARAGADAEDIFSMPLPGVSGERWLSVRVRPLGAANGVAPAGEALWQIRDVTIERERETMQGQALDRFRRYLDDAPVGFFSANAEGRIDYLNRSLASWVGVDAEQALERGFALSDLVAGDVALLSVAAGGDATGSRVLDIDLAGPEGRAVPVRMVQMSPLESEGDGAVDGTIDVRGAIRMLVHNRSDAQLDEEMMRDVEMRFSRFFNNAPIGIATVDGSGEVDLANASFMSFVGQPVKAGQKLVDLVVPEDRDAVSECLEETLSGKIARPPFDIRMESRSDKVAQLYAARVDGADSDEDPGASVIVYLIDATEQKSLEMQFAQSQKMQAVGQLAGGVAHDFNNLLTAIIGFGDLLLARHPAGDPSFADIMQVKQNANRAANLVRQLLAFSRRQTLRPKVLSLTDAIAELQNLISRLIGETIELKIVHGRDLGLVKVDQNQLEQVIMNLAVNARDAMPEGGTVTVRTANISEEDSRALDHALMPAAEYVLIEVTDTGVGIAKEHLGKIFEPFFTTKDVNRGTGLGLSTVYGIIKQTGGYIFPFSAIGKGTTFRIYLPRHYRTSAEQAASDAPVVEEAKDLTGKGTILLVEDEDAVRTFAARALKTRGYEVLEAESGEAALDVVDEFDGQIDLVVSDVVMPSMDGPTMVKELRIKRPETKIIFISGYAEDAFRKSLDQPDDFRFLPKPFSLKQLAATVKEVMAGS